MKGREEIIRNLRLALVMFDTDEDSLAIELLLKTAKVLQSELESGDRMSLDGVRFVVAPELKPNRIEQMGEK